MVCDAQDGFVAYNAQRLKEMTQDGKELPFWEKLAILLENDAADNAVLEEPEEKTQYYKRTKLPCRHMQGKIPDYLD